MIITTLKLANKVYKRNRSDETRNLVISKRREYCKVKRKARYVYKSIQKQKFHDLSKTLPQKFWSEIRKIQGKTNNTSNLPPSDFFDHFQNLYSAPDMFVNEDVENYFSNEDATEIKIDQLDRDFV